MLAIVGQQSRRGLGGSYQQEVDLVSLFKDVANEYVQMAVEPAQIRHLVDRAHRIALDRAHGDVRSSIPNDLAEEPAEETPPREHGSIVLWHRFYAAAHRAAARPSSNSAAQILNAGRKVAMLVGQGALGAADEVIETAELLGAGVAKALLGKAVVPDDLPFVTGSIGLLGTKPSWTLMNELRHAVDGRVELPVLGVAAGAGPGARRPDRHRRPDAVDPLPMECPLVGDAQETLRELLPLLERKSERSWREHLEEEIEDWWRLLEDSAHAGSGPDQSAAACSGSSSTACPTTRSSASTRARPRTGSRATSSFGRGHARVAVRDAGDDGVGRPVRDRGEVRVTRTVLPSRSSATARCR